MTPQEKADSVVNRNKDKFRRYLKEAEMLLQIPRNIDYRAARMIEMMDDISAITAPVATCANGCDYCCYQAVAVSTWEVDRIAKYAKRKPTGFIGYSPERGEEIGHITDQFSGMPCPFLKEKTCTIYPVRPFVCRSHFSLSDDMTDCSLSLKPGGRVTYFNLEEFKTAFCFLALDAGCSFGDIREFFG